MPEVPKTESPLAEFWRRRNSKANPANAGLRFTERPFLTHLNLRGDPNDRSLQAAVQSALQLNLPVVANTTSSSSDTSILWLGPDEWLVITTAGKATQLEASIGRENSSLHYALTDVSSGQTVLSVSGPNVLDVLEQGCALDLDPAKFKAGECAQTHLGKSNITIWHPSESVAYNIVVRRSFADYVALWLEDAANGVGFEAVPGNAAAETDAFIPAILRA